MCRPPCWGSMRKRRVKFRNGQQQWSRHWHRRTQLLRKLYWSSRRSQSMSSGEFCVWIIQGAVVTSVDAGHFCCYRNLQVHTIHTDTVYSFPVLTQPARQHCVDRTCTGSALQAAEARSGQAVATSNWHNHSRTCSNSGQPAAQTQGCRLPTVKASAWVCLGSAWASPHLPQSVAPASLPPLRYIPFRPLSTVCTPAAKMTSSFPLGPRPPPPSSPLSWAPFCQAVDTENSGNWRVQGGESKGGGE